MAQSVVVLPATATALGVVAMWTPEQRAFLMDGPRPTPRALVLLGGAAHLLVQWRRHREEMLAACPAGRRPWGFWAIEKRFKIVPLGDTWFERYVGRYHQFFSYWPMREVMRRTPTYMIFDDHDVKDDWGITEVQDEGRVDAALDAYRRFQQAHNPGGADRPAFHYDFTWGPAAFTSAA